MIKRHPPFFSIYIVFFLSLTSPLLKAATPQVQITARPAWVSSPFHQYKKSTIKAANDGYFYALWDEQIHVEDKASYNHIIREIITDAGVQNGSDITINFDPLYEKLEFHKITVWRDNKPINHLKKSAFKVVANEEDMSRFLYHGSYTAFLILDDIRKGDQIEYSYTLRGGNPIFGDKYSNEIYFQGIEPIAHLYTSLIFSATRNLNFKNFNKVPNSKVVIKGNLKKYEWEAFNVSAPVYENYQPDWVNNFASVQVTEYKSWQEVVSWAEKTNTIPSELKGPLAAWLKHLVSSEGSEEKRFREAIRFVQDEVRYMGIEMGKYSHQASQPEKVFNQRYGDCKDKSLLLASMLKALGIEAHLALVNTRASQEILTYLPTPKVFNHMVVVAKLNGVDVWIDPTISGQGGSGIELAFPDYKKALVIKNGNSQISDTEMGPAGKIVCNERYLITDEKEKVKLVVETIYTANQADLIRSQLSSLSHEQICKNYLDYYSKIYPEISIIDSLQINDHRNSNELTVIESYYIAGFFQKDPNSRYTAGFYANFIKEQLPSFAASRKQPVAVNYPFDLDYTIQVDMKTGWDIKKESSEISRDDYHFAKNIFVVGNVLNINYQFWYFNDHIKANKASEFAKDIRQLENSDLSYSINYHPPLAQGDYRINYWFIALSVIFLAALIYLAVRESRRKTEATDIYLDGYMQPLQGWVFLPIIGLFVTPVSSLLLLIGDNYYSMNLWELSYTREDKLAFQGAILFELLFNLFIIVCAVFCLYLFYKKRDILPKVIIFYFVVSTLGCVIDLLLTSNIIADNSEYVNTLVRTIIASAIWIPYFHLSPSVKATFVIPYPEQQTWEDQRKEPLLEEYETQ